MENQANLRDWRKSKGWNQEAMAGKLGSGQSTYQSWESGRTPVPFDVQAKLRKMGYEGSWPLGLGPKVSLVSGEEQKLTAEAFLELRGTVKDLREDVKRLERIQFALIGAIRQLAKVANLPHLDETLE